MEPVREYSCEHSGGRSAFDVLLGDQGYRAVAVAEMFPSPSPPVCRGRYVPLNGCGTVTPSAAHCFWSRVGLSASNHCRDQLFRTRVELRWSCPRGARPKRKTPSGLETVYDSARFSDLPSPEEGIFGSIHTGQRKVEQVTHPW